MKILKNLIKQHKKRKEGLRKKELRKKKKEMRREKDIEKAISKKFIELYFSFILDKNNKPKIVREVAGELFMKILTCYGIYTTNNEFIDIIYEGQNSVLSLGGEAGLAKRLNKAFLHKVTKEKDCWNITINATDQKRRKDMYSLKELREDHPILTALNSDLLETIAQKEGEDTFNPIFINGKPAIERKAGALILNYKVEDALNSEIAEDYLNILGEVRGFISIIKDKNFLKGFTPTKKELVDRIKWLKEVDKLLEKE